MAELSSHIQQQQQEMESYQSRVSSARQWVCSAGWWAGSGEALAAITYANREPTPGAWEQREGSGRGIQLCCSCTGATVTIFHSSNRLHQRAAELGSSSA